MTIGAIVLAAGASSRMGTPKQALELDGRSLLRRAALAALEAGLRPVVVVTGANVARSREQIAGLEVVEAENAAWATGMGSSVVAGLRALLDAAPGTDAVVLTVCDQPFVTPALLRALADHEGPAIAAADEPFPGRYEPSQLPVLRAALREEASLRRTLARLAPAVLGASTEQLRSLNRPEDLE